MNREDILCLDPGQNHAGAGPAGEAGFRGSNWVANCPSNEQIVVHIARN
jgi:hypothetical protein